MNNHIVLEILEHMNQLIYANLKNLAVEQYAPSGDVDRSDDLIRDCKERHKKLTKIREEFEIVCSDAII